MTDDDTTAPDETPRDEAPPDETRRPRLRDRVYGLRGLVAVGVAGLVLGGAAGTAVGFAADNDGPDQRPGRFGSPYPGHEPDGFRPPGPESPPSTAPDEQVEPDGSSEGSGGTNS
jgi:hypothetical protein